MATASIRRSEAGSDGMVSKSELPINAVTSRKPKVLCRKGGRLGPKGEWPGAGIENCPAADVAATGGEAGPKPSGCVCGTC